MNIGTTLIITLIFFGVLGAMGFLVMRALKKSGEEDIDSSIKDNVETAQEFLPFQGIKNNVIDMGGFNYVAVIECSSTNYKLKTDTEKEIIELSFQRFLNALTFPITLYVQTRLLDNSKLLSDMEKELSEITQESPQMKGYADSYFKEMSNLNDYIGNNKQKKKYIIVPYNEAVNLGSLSKKEKYEYSLKEIQQRALILTEGLSSMGIKGRLLDTQGLVELVYSSYHKDNFGDHESIFNGEFFSLFVEREKNPEAGLSDDKRADWILYEAQTRLKDELLSKNIPDFLKKDYEDIITEINNMREKVGGGN